MVVPVIDQGRDGAAVEKVQPAACEREPLFRQVHHWRREVDPRLEPRLDPVTIVEAMSNR